MKQKAIFPAMVSMLAIAVGSVWGAGEILPFGDGFDAGTSGAALSDPWSFTDVGRYDSSQTTVDGSSQSAYFSNEGTFSIDTDQEGAGNGPYSNVWWKCYAKVTAAGSDPIIDTNTVAAFYIKSDGTLRVYNGGSWEQLTNGLSTAGWIGLAVHLDYSQGKWDIYKTPEGYTFGDEAEKLNSRALSFNPGYTATNFTQAVIEGTTYIDRFAVNADTVVVNDSTPDKAANAAADIIIGENLTGVLTKYFTAADSKMSGPLGDALHSALLSGDKVYIFNTGVWVELEAKGPGRSFYVVTGGFTLSDLTITPTTAVFVDFGSGTGTREPAHVVAYSTLQQPSNAVVLYGTDQTSKGWTALCVPFGAGSTSVSGLGLSNPSSGDMMLIMRTDGGYDFVSWDTQQSRWEIGGADAASEALTEGQSFWYFKNSAGNGTWNADAAFNVN